MEDIILFKYSKNSRKEGIRKLWYILPGGLLAMAFSYFMLLHVIKPPPPSYFTIPFLAIFAVIFLFIIFGYIIPNIILNKEFSVLITQYYIECNVPSPIYGTSFHISIKDIRQILKHPLEESKPEWYIITAYEKKIQITCNYNNPISTVIKILREQNPEIEMIEEKN